MAKVPSLVLAHSCIAFGRDDWERQVGLPLQTCDELVATGLLRSLKVGRRRIFLARHVEELLAGFTERGEALEPRKLYLAQREQRKRAGGS